MLLLFDVDGTLLLTQRAGARAMQEAGRRLFGDAFDLARIELAGRLDPLILRDALAAAGVEDGSEVRDRFRALYRECLARRLAEERTALALPGVLGLLDRLAGRGDLVLGLLTGNYPETGRLKLEAAGIDPVRFRVSAWGVDAPDRRGLVPVARERAREATRRAFEPQEVVVVGDTPHDIDCIRAHGGRAVAVASGPAYARDQLEVHAPDLLLEDLRDHDGFVAWLEGLRRGP